MWKMNKSNSNTIQLQHNPTLRAILTKEVLDKIYEPYFTTKTDTGGTGIGLHMTKTIIEKNMNGHIHVSNDVDGAVFIIDFNSNLHI